MNLKAEPFDDETELRFQTANSLETDIAKRANEVGEHHKAESHSHLPHPHSKTLVYGRQSTRRTCSATGICGKFAQQKFLQWCRTIKNHLSFMDRSSPRSPDDSR